MRSSDASVGARSKESLVVPMLALRRESYIPIRTHKERSRTHKRIRSKLLNIVREEVLRPKNRGQGWTSHTNEARPGKDIP